MTSSEIVKTGTMQVIPSSEMKGLENALAELQQEGEKLAELKTQAEAFKVINTAEEYGSAGQILAQVRSVKKAAGFKMNPFLEVADRITKFLRNTRSAHETECELIDNPLSQKMSDYKRREREAAEREQQRINEERRRDAEAKAKADREAAEKRAEEDRKKREAEIKAAQKAGEVGKREADRLKKQADEEAARQKEAAEKEAHAQVASVQDVKVAPSIPKIAGLKGRVSWSWKMVDINKVPRELLYPLPNENGEYDIEKFPRIGKLVRETKDKAKAQAACPGIEVTSEDRV